MSTLLTQIEACLNSRPLVTLPNDDDGIEALTPSHFLIECPLQALTIRLHMPTLYLHSGTGNYVNTPNSITLQETSPLITLSFFEMILHCPLNGLWLVHPGRGNLVRVVTVKTRTGVYTSPVTKLALLLPSESKD